MTTRQINELYGLCYRINMLAVGKEDAPVVLFQMIGDNIYQATILIEIYSNMPYKRVKSFVVSADKKVDKEYRKNLKLLSDIKKRLEGKENE